MDDFSSSKAPNETAGDHNKQISNLRNRFFDQWNRGKYNEAKKWASFGMYYCFDHNVEEHVDHFRALIDYADSNFNNAEKLLAGSIANFDNLDDISSGHIQAYEDYALLLYEVYKYREAYALLRKISGLYERIGMTPPVRFFTRAAMICESLEKHKERETYLLRAKDVDPDDYLFLTNYMVMKWDQYYTAHDKDRYKQSCLDEMLEASQKLLKHVERPEEDAILMNNVGALCYLQKKYKESVEYLEAALAINPDIALVSFNKGLAEFRLNKFDEARRSFENASENYRKENNIGRSKNSSLFVNICRMKIANREETGDDDKGFLSFLFDFVDTIDNSENFFIGRFVSDSQFQKEFLRDQDITKPRNSLYFLRGWHAHYPPLMPVQYPVGGGYFLRWNNRGIIIDPGYHFIRNFIENRMSITDIDAVIITSSAIDHSSDFEAILFLLNTINDLRQKDALGDDSIESFIRAKLPSTDRKIDLIITHDALKKFKIQAKGTYKKVIHSISVFEPERKAIELDSIDGDGQDSKIRVIPIESTITPGRRDDRPYGFVMELYGSKGSGVKRIGYTSDTRWSKEIEMHYQNCYIMITHLGPIRSMEFRADGPRAEKLSNQHFGLYGCYRTIKFIQPKILFIGDMGTELARRKGKVIAQFNNPGFFNNSDSRKTKTISTDVGMILDLTNLTIRTKDMIEFTPYSEIEEKFDIKEDRYKYI